MESTYSKYPVIGTLRSLVNCREFGLDLDGDRWCQELKIEIREGPPSDRLNTRTRGKSLGSLKGLNLCVRYLCTTHLICTVG